MKVLVISTHPDDPKLLCAGTLVKFKKQGAEVFTYYVYDGNKGGKVYSSEELAKIRRKEALESVKLIVAT